MKVLLVFTLIIMTLCGSDIQSQIDEIAKQDYGKKMIKDVQFVFRSNKNLPLDTIVTLNSMENDLVAAIEKDMKIYQSQQQKNIEQKQDIKQQIFLTKYTITNIGEEVTMLENELKFAQDIHQQRQELLKQQQQLLPQLVAIRNDEQSRMDQYFPEIDQSKQFIDSVKIIIESITDLESYFSSQSSPAGLSAVFFHPILLFFQQKQLDKTKNSRDDSMDIKMHFEEQSQNLQRTYQQFVKKLNDQNPYIKLVGSFMPMIIFDNLSQMKTIMEILIKLEQEIQQQLDNLQEINNERQRYFNEQKNRLQQDSDKWSQEMNAIDPVVKATQEKLDSLKKQLDDQNVILMEQQQKLEESQKFNDNYQSQYQNKHKEDLFKMGLIRQMKQLVYEHQSAVEDYLKSKVFV